MHEEDIRREGESQDWRETLLMNAGNADKQSEQLTQPQAIQEKSGSPEENAVMPISKLEDNLPLSTDPAQDSPTVELSRPRRVRHRPACNELTLMRTVTG